VQPKTSPITKRLKELRQERDLEGIVETSPIGITVVDAEMGLTFVNERAEKIYGRPREGSENSPTTILVGIWLMRTVNLSIAVTRRSIEWSLTKNRVHDQTLGLSTHPETASGCR